MVPSDAVSLAADFKANLDRRSAISAVFDPLLQSQAAAHPSSASDSPSTGALYLTSVNQLKRWNLDHRAKRLVVLNELLGVEYSSIVRLLLLAAQLTDDDIDKIPKLDKQKDYPQLNFYDPVVFSSRKLDAKKKVTFKTEKDAGKCRTDSSPSPDQGILLDDESPRSKVLATTSERLDFNEALMVQNPAVRWIEVPFVELKSALVSLVYGHETWLFQKTHRSRNFALLPGVFLRGFSHTGLESALSPLVDLANKFLNLERVISAEQTKEVTCVYKLYLLSCTNLLSEKRGDFAMRVTRDDGPNGLLPLLQCATSFAQNGLLFVLAVQTLIEHYCSDSSLLISLNGMCKVSYPFEVSDLAHLTSKVFIYVLRLFNKFLSCGRVPLGLESFLKAPSKSRTDPVVETFEFLPSDLAEQIHSVVKLRNLARDWPSFRQKHRRNYLLSEKIENDATEIESFSKFDWDFGKQFTHQLRISTRTALTDPYLLECQAEYLEKFSEILGVLRRVFLHEDRRLSSALAAELLEVKKEDYDSPMRLNCLLNSVLFNAGYPAHIVTCLSFAATNDLGSTNDRLFELRFKVPFPVEQSISPSTVQAYGRIWRLLMRLNMAKTFLLMVRNLIRFDKQRPKAMALATFGMLNFIGSVQGHFWHQIVQVLRMQYQDQFANAKTVDDLRAVHAKYVGSMVTRCFLNPKAAAFLQLLLGSVETAVAFCHAASSQDSYLASIKSREFAKLTRKFVKMVRILSDTGYDVSLQNLVLRLDFSGFYKRQDDNDNNNN